MRPMRRSVALVLALGAVAAGCGADHPPLSPACSEDAGKVLAALAAAPGEVRLADGTPLSRCVTEAASGSDVESIGLVFTDAADSLARRAGASDVAALRLGYLVGATARGAKRTGGVHVELVRRLQSVAPGDDAPAARRAAYGRGLAAGLRAG
ncbi:MAG: hypothetical protein QOK31_77 [Solirubrobacteraceae bacterium]|nr:hypothetical protein [Solirubrobacteraceae bacterium]